MHSPWGTRFTGGGRGIVRPGCDFLLSLCPYKANTRAQLRASILLEREQNPENLPWHGTALARGRAGGTVSAAPSRPPPAFGSRSAGFIPQRLHGVLGPVAAKEGKSLPWKADDGSCVRGLCGPEAGP